MDRRVVITGIGAVTPLGNAKQSWEKILKGESAISKLESFNPDEYKPDKYFPRIAGQIKKVFTPEELGLENTKWINKIDRSVIFSIAAAQEAVANSGFCFQEARNPMRAGAIVGCAFGGVETVYEQAKILFDPKRGASRISPHLISKMISNTTSAYLCVVFKIKGISYTISSACASGAHAVGEMFDKIRFGRLDIGLAGGTEAWITPLVCAGFGSMQGAYSRRNLEPTKASRPYDKDRDGFVASEGAAILVLEELKHAQKRQAYFSRNNWLRSEF